MTGLNSALDLTEVSPILDFARKSADTDVGFGSLDLRGLVDHSLPISTLITARMTFSFAIAVQLGSAKDLPLVQRGIRALLNELRDHEFGGFRTSLAPHPRSGEKRAYETCFVLLAASAAHAVGVVGAKEVAAEAQRNIEDHFWNEKLGVMSDSFDISFERAEPYFGANANMHAVEALMAAAKVFGDRTLVDKAVRIADFMINRHARSKTWMLPEHFTENGEPMLDYNIEFPAHEFRPYGVTIGHLFEWSRLLVELDTIAEDSERWRLDAAAHLYQSAKTWGWAVDGQNGFIYTINWEAQPVVRTRPYWVLAEAISAAAALRGAKVVPSASADLEHWQRFALDNFRDRELGGWHHELDIQNRPSHTMWSGKPDVYHSLQAMLIPQLPADASLTSRIRKVKGDICW
jgi:mannose/cellobiose epimerase-like protein (N-acyl-D-glucosamine 2-epimerase family)